MSITKASGFRGDKFAKWWTKNSKYGVRYQCSDCGKITLGQYGTSDSRMHHTTCPRRSGVSEPDPVPASAPASTASGSITCEPRRGFNECGVCCIQLPDIGDIAPGDVIATCLADAERLLTDQHMEPTALNWIVLCDHFLSLPLISVGRALAFRRLREAIERAALGAVRIATNSTSQLISQKVSE